MINFIYYSEHEDYEIEEDKEREEGDIGRGGRVKPKRRQKRGQSRGGQGREGRSRGGRGRGGQERRGRGRGAQRGRQGRGGGGNSTTVS